MAVTKTKSTNQPTKAVTEATFQQAVAFHQEGNFPEAERLYRSVLTTHPDHANTHYNLGVLAVQTKQPANGLPHFLAALDADPSRGQYWLSYIDALLQSGEIQSAKEVLSLAQQQGLQGEEVNNLVSRLETGAATETHLLKEKLHAPQKSLPVKTSTQKKSASHKNKSPSTQEINALVTLFSQGQYTEAAPLAQTMTQRHPLHEFGWKALGAALMQLGKSADALAPMQKATSLSPKDVEAQYNYGSILQALGRLEDAEISYRRALRINPNYAHAHCNLGSALQGMGRINEAESSYRRALKINPEYAKAHSNLGAALQDMGKMNEAEESYRKAIQIQPDNNELYYNLSITLKDLGRLNEAEVNCRKALQLNPDYADAYYHLGNILHDLARLDDAESCYRRAVQIKPSYVEVLNNLALLLNEQGKSMAALNTAKQSLQIKESEEGKNIFVSSLKRMRFLHDDAEIRLLMSRALTEAWDRPSELAKMSTDFVQLNWNIEACVTRANDVWPRQLSVKDLFGTNGLATLSPDPLLNALLDSTPICDIKLERFLTMTRHAMLEAAILETADSGEGKQALIFYSALARQCFINEYVFSHTDEEIQTAQKLRDELTAAFANSTQVSSLKLITVAAYFPLCSLPHATQILDKQWPNEVTSILKQQVIEPEEEFKLRVTIPQITPIENEVSLLVQNQYEQNPYPRWVKTARVGKAKNIVSYLCHKFPLATFNRHSKSSNIDILIAGCGTGQHSITTAQRSQGAQVLAVDLSLSSLAYAKRKSQEMGLTTIAYAQADTLKLGQLGRSFDVIESVGVLHHLADPWAGWQVLLSILRPNGFMKLGFYSEIARRNIVRIRNHISTQGYGITIEDIRRCRQDLIDLNTSNEFGGTLSSPDFFSISTCRDLLFHVQEHRMVLSDINIFLSENNLQFMGFEIEPHILQAYKLRFPNDLPATNLEQWEIFENENPDIFFSMYQFWIQKMT